MNLGNLGRQTFAAPLAALTLVAGGGIALAASGGDPAPQAVEHRTVAKPSATGKPTAKPAEDRAEDRADDRSDESTSDGSPSPSLTGLCRAYRAGGYASSTKNGHVNPAWSALESAAGGEDDVDEYCDDRLAADSDDVDESKAGNPGRGPKPANARGGDRGESGSHASEHGNH
jgi:hypothetical protein